MTVAIVTDGAASLPDDRARTGNVTVVPLRVRIGTAIIEDAPATLAAHAPVMGYITEFDAAMAAHLGPGVVGLAWWREQHQSQPFR
jgi:fatty acid-binding protein DegV